MMKSSISTGAVMIALRYFPTGGRSFGPGDLFPHKDLSDFTERRLMQMQESRHIGPLTRESYARAMASREAGYIGKGFTRDGLIAMGILDNDAPAGDGQGGDEPWTPDPATYQVVERYGDIWLAGAKRGVATRFDLFDLEGNRLNPGKTENGVKKAREAADAIVATAEAERLKKQPLFADYPADLADWSDDQREAFDAWFAALPEDDETPHHLLPAAVERFKQLQAELAEQEGGQGDDVLFADLPEDATTWTPEQLASVDDWFWALETGADTSAMKLAPAAAQRVAGLEALNAMSDEDLGQMLTDADLKPAGTESHRELVELAILIPPSTEGGDSDTPSAEEQKEGGDGGDVRSDAGGSEGSSPPEAG